MSDTARIMLIGFGNPGRLDDGLGPLFAEAMAERQVPGLTVDADYQLTVEAAAYVAEHDIVVFADAAVDGPEPFWINAIEPVSQQSFSSHSVAPEAVLGLAHDLFGAKTKGYLLGMRGYEFNEFDERLSEQAQKNLEAALAHFEPVFRTGNVAESAEEFPCLGGYRLSNSNQEEPCKTENT